MTVCPDCDNSHTKLLGKYTQIGKGGEGKEVGERKERGTGKEEKEEGKGERKK